MCILPKIFGFYVIQTFPDVQQAREMISQKSKGCLKSI
jgi:hypothetical protein